MKYKPNDVVIVNTKHFARVYSIYENHYTLVIFPNGIYGVFNSLSATYRSATEEDIERKSSEEEWRRHVLLYKIINS